MNKEKRWYRINLFTNEIDEVKYIIGETDKFVILDNLHHNRKMAKKGECHEFMLGTYSEVVEHLLYILSYKILKLKDALIKCECDYKALERTIEK